MRVRAAVVEVGLTISGDIDTFSTDEQDSFRMSLRNTLGCHEPSCSLTLRVSAASVSVSVILVIPSASEGDSATAAAAASTAAAVASAAARLVSLDLSAISACLGMTVTAAAPISIGQAEVPLVVAPPPPTLPSPSAPLSQFPSSPLLANDTVDDSQAALSSGTNSSDGTGMDNQVDISVIGVSVVVVAVLVAIVFASRRARSKHTRRARSATRSLADQSSDFELGHRRPTCTAPQSPSTREPPSSHLSDSHDVGRREGRVEEVEVVGWSPGASTCSPGLLPSSHEEVLLSVRVLRLKPMLCPASQWILHSPGELVALSADSEMRITEARVYIQVASGSDGPLKQWPLSDLQGLKRRRYQLQHTAIELVFARGEDTMSEVVNFHSHEDRERVVRTLRSQQPRLTPPDDCLEQLTEQWALGEIDNFTYLMHLNDCASRTFYDLSQYPIM